MSGKILKNHEKQPTPSPPVRRKIVLTRVGHVRGELAKLYGEARNGVISTTEASKLANILSILARIIEGSDLEARLTEIETLISKGDGPR